nr:pyridoxine 5'-phosphate synthase [Deltaproteobacteria bacterium]
MKKSRGLINEKELSREFGAEHSVPVLIRSTYSKFLPLLRLRRAAEILLRSIGRSGTELSILLVDDAEMMQLNRQWLRRSCSTNVISFSQHGDDFRQPDNDLLGDVVISVDTARLESANAGVELGQRLEELLVHGLVHLLGEDHELGPVEAERMKCKEQALLSALYKELRMADLCINIDHVATVRQARGTTEPDPVTAAGIVEMAGADGIVVHLREDRRHIQDRDVRLLRQTIKTRLTLEMAATEEMIGIASDIRPDIVTLVPEGREELTTEGGLDVVTLEKQLTTAVTRLHDANIPVSLFVDPERDQIMAAKQTGADCIEIHTGLYADAPSSKIQDREFEKIVAMARAAMDLDLRVHAGHGLNYRNTARLAAVSEIQEFSIGHAVIGRAVLVGLERAVREMLSLVQKGYLE